MRHSFMKITFILPNHNEEKIHWVIQEIEKLFDDCQIIITCDRYGKGKGWAIRQAVEHIEGDIVCFLDGDGDIHPRMVLRMLPFLEDYDIVLGKKQIRGLLSRRILTRLSRWLIYLMFGFAFDTQTGIKLFNYNTLPRWDSNSFAFDLEVLAKARNAGWSIAEVPVDVTIQRKMHTRSILSCLFEAFKIWGTVNVKSNNSLT